MAEIKSFEDAEKAIEKLRLVSGSSQNLMYNTGLQQALDILRELEAGVRERIELFSHEKTSEEMCTLIDCEHLLPIKDDVPLCDKSGDDCNPFVCKLFHQHFCEKRLGELRRLLSVRTPLRVEGEKG